MIKMLKKVRVKCMTELVETVREEEKDLQLQSFATLTALKGEQFGKQIFKRIFLFLLILL